MDGREGMALQGSTPYYLHRAISGTQQQQGGHNHGSSVAQLSAPQSHPLQGFRPSVTTTTATSLGSHPNLAVVQPVVIRPSGGSLVGVTGFNVDGGGGAQVNVSPPPQGFNINMASSAGGSMSGPVKKKRGRPRKYGPGGSGGPGSVSESGSGNMSLALSPSTPGERKKRGRPLGSGRKQRLASVGEWMSNSAGAAFMPHVVHVAPGEDIAGKILAFAQQRPRALCIMSGCGGVSAVTLRQPGSSAGTVTFEGRFQILCLSGSYLVAESGGAHNRTGGVNVSLSSPDGQVIGGAVGGRLVASRPVQVVVCSFVYGNIKGKSKESEEKDEKNCEQLVISDKTSVQIDASPSQNIPASWPDMKAVNSKNPNTDIDLASG